MNERPKSRRANSVETVVQLFQINDILIIREVSRRGRAIIRKSEQAGKPVGEPTIGVCIRRESRNS